MTRLKVTVQDDRQIRLGNCMPGDVVELASGSICLVFNAYSAVDDGCASNGNSLVILSYGGDERQAVLALSTLTHGAAEGVGTDRILRVLGSLAEIVVEPH